MILRPRQALLVERTLCALDQFGDTLSIGPTGSGKTIMMSAVTGRRIANSDAKACVLAHRVELTGQNRQKFSRVNPDISTSVFDASEKSWKGQTTFASVQTLCRKGHLEQMPALDLLVIDEAHHATSQSYRTIIDRVRSQNPAAAVCGFTATPNRGDGKGLREVFSNVADQITLGELIASGHLVSPKTYVIDVGVQQQLRDVPKTASEFDMDKVAAIMDTQPITDAVIHHWKARAQDRKTIVFCSTVKHAEHVCERFLAAGISASLVHGELSKATRQQRLADFEQGDVQVLVNVAVLTEGYDYTPTSCIVLLRPSSCKSTMIQMIGRGLRIVDPAEHPGVIKTDCVVLDFGTACLTHGSLEQSVDLDGNAVRDIDEAPPICPSCGARLPPECNECPFCERSILPERRLKQEISEFVMSEIDLLNSSNFRWEDLFGDDDALMATGFSAWSGVFFLNGRWHAVGGGEALKTQLLGVGARTVCVALSDDWLNAHESIDSAHKTRRWLNQPPSTKQLKYLPQSKRADFGMTRYQASCFLSFQFNRSDIRRLVMEASGQRECAA